MAENKKETNIDFVKRLVEHKANNLGELSKALASMRSRAAVLTAAIRAKRDALLAATEEPAQPDVKETPRQTVAVEQPRQPVEETVPAVENKTEEVKEAVSEKPKTKSETAKDKASAKPSKKKEEVKPEQAKVPVVEMGADGKPRRIFEGPTTAPKATKGGFVGFNVQQSQRTQRPQQGRQQGMQQGGQRVSRMASLSNLAQNAPVKPSTQKNKGGKTASQSSSRTDDRTKNRYALVKKGFIVDDKVEYDENGDEIVRNHKIGGRNRSGGSSNVIIIENAVITTDPVPIKTLSEKIGKSAAEIVRALFQLGEMKTINDSIDFATAELVADEFSVKLEYKPEVTLEETLSAQHEVDEVEDIDNLIERPPVVTIMGHVDHGKTSLLDYIRKSNVTGGEAGGITQHIGAYTVSLNGSPITFLDTPGHEAFTSMRARGAQVTDIAVLVVAADDGIMPQTIEAINHAKQANVPIIVALNKMDKNGANPDRVLQQLTEYGITPEEWGGETPVVRVSAKTGMGIEDLLEQILVRAEVEELRANPNRSARGTIIEAKLDKGLGKIATILVQTGTLRIGDNVVAGTSTGKIRAMIDDKGRKVKSAGPSMPVSVTGWNDVPEAGDRIDVVEDERFAKQLAEERRLKQEAAQNQSAAVSLNDLFDKISKGELKSVKLIIKADVQGSVEAVKQSLAKLGNEEVTIDIIHSAVGGIKESDVLLAETAGAIIIGFNVRPDPNAKSLAAQKKIDIRFYDIIYNAIEDIEKAVKGLLAPKFVENVLGSAEIRELFKISGVGTIAGCHVIDGKVTRTAKARLIRNGKVEYTGEIASLRHGKEDVKEMARNFDCGIMLSNYQDVKVGDIIEAFQMVQVNED